MRLAAAAQTECAALPYCLGWHLHDRACAAPASAAIEAGTCLQGNITNPDAGYSTINYASLTLPAPVAPITGPNAPATSGTCNGYLPNDTILNRCQLVQLALQAVIASLLVVKSVSNAACSHPICTCKLLCS